MIHLFVPWEVIILPKTSMVGGMVYYSALCDKNYSTSNSLWVHVLGCRKQEDRVKLKGGKVVKRRHTQCLSQHHRTDILTPCAACGPFKHSTRKKADICVSLDFGCLLSHGWGYRLHKDTFLVFISSEHENKQPKNEVGNSEERGHSTVQNMLCHWWWNHKQLETLLFFFFFPVSIMCTNCQEQHHTCLFP